MHLRGSLWLIDLITSLLPFLWRRLPGLVCPPPWETPYGMQMKLPCLLTLSSFLMESWLWASLKIFSRFLVTLGHDRLSGCPARMHINNPSWPRRGMLHMGQQGIKIRAGKAFTDPLTHFWSLNWYFDPSPTKSWSCSFCLREVPVLSATKPVPATLALLVEAVGHLTAFAKETCFFIALLLGIHLIYACLSLSLAAYCLFLQDSFFFLSIWLCLVDFWAAAWVLGGVRGGTVAWGRGSRGMGGVGRDAVARVGEDGGEGSGKVRGEVPKRSRCWACSGPRRSSWDSSTMLSCSRDSKLKPGQVMSRHSPVHEVIALPSCFK